MFLKQLLHLLLLLLLDSLFVGRIPLLLRESRVFLFLFCAKLILFLLVLPAQFSIVEGGTMSRPLGCVLMDVNANRTSES